MSVKINLDVLALLEEVNNGTMLFKKGDLLTTSKGNDVILRYRGDAIFDENFAVDELKQFIGALKTFSSYSFEKKENYIIFRSNKDKSSFKYVIATDVVYDNIESFIQTPMNLINNAFNAAKDKKAEKFIFEITEEKIKELKGISKDFGLKDLSIRFLPDKKKVELKLLNTDVNDNEFSAEETLYKDSNIDREIQHFIEIDNLLEKKWTCYFFEGTEYFYFVNDEFDMIVSTVNIEERKQAAEQESAEPAEKAEKPSKSSKKKKEEPEDED